jgi:hypothetical protein
MSMLIRSALGIRLTKTVASLFAGMFASFFLCVASASAADTVTGSTYQDLNEDGTIDTIRITLDEVVTACPYDGGDWVFSNPGSLGAIMDVTGVTCTGADAIIQVQIDGNNQITGGAVSPSFNTFRQTVRPIAFCLPAAP